MDRSERAVILIVDDIPENLKVLGKTLEKEGYDISIATNGKAALEIMENISPDLILLDILMPELNGFDVCELIKKNPKHQHIPVVFLTAKASSEDLLKGFKLGAADYITKPFNPNEVLVRVNTHIELKFANDSNREYIRQLEEMNCELTKTKLELDEINRSKDKFFSIIAHDLKNPFQGFIGLSDLLMEEYHNFSDEDRQDLITEMNKSSKKLNKLLENLLTWSRLQMGRMEITPMLINLHKIAEESMSFYTEALNSKGIAFINNIPADTSFVIDKNVIDTVFRNLFNNAIKFNNQGGSIQVSYEKDSAYTTISISDTGIGMTPQEQKQLFRIDANNTKKGTSDEPGTGLGLILCKDLINKSGGEISVESSSGEGTTFVMKFPVVVR